MNRSVAGWVSGEWVFVGWLGSGLGLGPDDWLVYWLQLYWDIVPARRQASLKTSMPSGEVCVPHHVPRVEGGAAPLQEGELGRWERTWRVKRTRGQVSCLVLAGLSLG